MNLPKMNLIFSNAMFMISAIRELFNTVISITQLDLALVIVIVKELAII